MKRILVPLDLATEPDAVTRVVADAAREADEFGADLIVLTTPRGLAPRCFGGTATRVWRRADAAVMLLKPPALIAA